MPFLIMALVSLIVFCGSLQSNLIEPLSKQPIRGVFGDSTLQFSSRFRIESFYGKNIQLLNSYNPTDQVIIPVRHTIDGNLLYEYGYEKYGYDIVTLQITVRNKGVWGSPESIASTDRSVVKLDEVVFGEHAHFLNRHYLWIREFWLQASLNEMFNLNFYNNHFFTAGFFPFELGHAIALGDAYSTDPDILGFYSPNAVDQYAPGIKLSGTLDYDELLAYDLYVAILTNRSDTFNNVNRRILGQQYDHQCQQERGFGKINWLAAGRFQLTMNRGDYSKIVFEPYFLFNDQREQEIEFLGDSSTKLATLGFSIEAEVGCVEMGFEFAHNLGRQDVKGWDRNVIKAVTREGSFDSINSQVIVVSATPPSTDVAGEKALYTSGNQEYINTAPRSQLQNDQIITPPSANPQLRNSNRRFRDSYVNTLSGYMTIWEMAFKCCDGLKVAVATGLATGDRNPNKDHNRVGDSSVDSNYRGFIGLQEQYAGNRVRSAFLMSGAGRIPRVVSFPADDLPDPFPDRNSRFTNLIYVGTGLCTKSGVWSINPNILSYWQEQPTRFFDRKMAPGREQFASPWLGIEFNLFVDACLDNSMKFFAVGSVFVPGMHYADIKGRGLTREQQKFLDRLDRTGIESGEQVPVLGTNAALSINTGLEYRF